MKSKVHPTYKTKYRVGNWSAYERALVHRGDSTLCSVEVLDMKDELAQAKARQYGVTRVPAVAVNGTLADCCSGGAIDSETLRVLGVGSPA